MRPEDVEAYGGPGIPDLPNCKSCCPPRDGYPDGKPRGEAWAFSKTYQRWHRWTVDGDGLKTLCGQSFERNEWWVQQIPGMELLPLVAEVERALYTVQYLFSHVRRSINYDLGRLELARSVLMRVSPLLLEAQFICRELDEPST